VKEFEKMKLMNAVLEESKDKEIMIKNQKKMLALQKKYFFIKS